MSYTFLVEKIGKILKYHKNILCLIYKFVWKSEYLTYLVKLAPVSMNINGHKYIREDIYRESSWWAEEGEERSFIFYGRQPRHRGVIDRGNYTFATFPLIAVELILYPTSDCTCKRLAAGLTVTDNGMSVVASRVSLGNKKETREYCVPYMRTDSRVPICTLTIRLF